MALLPDQQHNSSLSSTHLQNSVGSSTNHQANNPIQPGSGQTTNNTSSTPDSNVSISNPNSVLRIESVTWNRDSHELFDYESRHVFNKKYLLRKPARVFRSQLDVTVVADGNELPTSADYLLSVKARDGRFYIYPADRNVCCPASNLQPRKLWLIIKHLQRSSFPLGEGDVMKLGRFKLRVKQIVADVNSTSPVDFRLDDVEVPATELTTQESRLMQCRICLLEGGDEADPLVRACQCKGSIMYVHLDCLRHWVNGRLNLPDDPTRSCCFVRQIQCELCKSTFPSVVSAGGVKLPVVKVPNVQPPFIVLENMVGPTNRGVHLCSMAVKKECKLGRGHESDVRIADVSISRFHATIKFVDGTFYLEDHGSKFGTLVALRKPTMIERIEKLSVQVGRTVLKFSMEDNIPPIMSEDLLEITEPAGDTMMANDNGNVSANLTDPKMVHQTDRGPNNNNGTGNIADPEDLPLPPTEQNDHHNNNDPSNHHQSMQGGPLHPIYGLSTTGENLTPLGYTMVARPFQQQQQQGLLQPINTGYIRVAAPSRLYVLPNTEGTDAPNDFRQQREVTGVDEFQSNSNSGQPMPAVPGPRLATFGFQQFANQIYLPSRCHMHPMNDGGILSGGSNGRLLFESDDLTTAQQNTNNNMNNLPNNSPNSQQGMNSNDINDGSNRNLENSNISMEACRQPRFPSTNINNQIHPVQVTPLLPGVPYQSSGGGGEGENDPTPLNH